VVQAPDYPEAKLGWGADGRAMPPTCAAGLPGRRTCASRADGAEHHTATSSWSSNNPTTGSDRRGDWHPETADGVRWLGL